MMSGCHGWSCSVICCKACCCTGRCCCCCGRMLLLLSSMLLRKEGKQGCRGESWNRLTSEDLGCRKVENMDCHKLKRENKTTKKSIMSNTNTIRA